MSERIDAASILENQERKSVAEQARGAVDFAVRSAKVLKGETSPFRAKLGTS